MKCSARVRLSIFAIAVYAPVVFADAPAAIDFEKHIQPILAANCYKCHGPDKQKGDLRLDSKAAFMNGGENGKIVTPGKSADSLIVKHLLGIEDHRRMPPSPNEPLAAEQIELIRKWID